jgi:hypothetical protein
VHPAAADTAEGIARWWLPHAKEAALSQVEAALELLVQRRIVIRRELPGGNFIFSGAAPATRGPSAN